MTKAVVWRLIQYLIYCTCRFRLIQIVQHIKPREKKGEDLAFIRFRRWDPAADRMVDAIKKEVALEALKRANFPVKDELGSTSESSDSS